MTNTQTSVPMTQMVQHLYSQQGLGGFYRGFSANVSRACVLNGTKMSCYDQIKGWILTQTDWTRKDPMSNRQCFRSWIFMSLATAL